MKLEILLSCMHQTDDSLVDTSHITGDVLIVNQCDREGMAEYPTPRGVARMYFTTQRGLTKSRNMAIANSRGDICLLCDDDEVFEPDYEEKILEAYGTMPQADVIIFKMRGRTPSFPDKIRRLRFPLTMKVSSWQISFRRQRMINSGIRFDELLGAGTGNGAEEELKFLLECQRRGLKIFYVPQEIATVAQETSTWFRGFDARFFENRGATTRYILGRPLALAYGAYYVIRKRKLYRPDISTRKAWKALCLGIRRNSIGKQAAERKQYEDSVVDRSVL